MYQKQKKKLYIHELVENPSISYPAYYILGHTMVDNELLHDALIALHSFDFDTFHSPKSYEEIFKMMQSGMFPIYKEKYIIGYFGGKMMYLETSGWKAMRVTQEIFKLENWLVA